MVHLTYHFHVNNIDIHIIMTQITGEMFVYMFVLFIMNFLFQV